MAVAGAEEGEEEEEEKGATMPPPRPSLPLFWTGKALLLLLLLLILLFCPAPASAPLYHSCLRSVRYIGMLSPFLPFPSPPTSGLLKMKRKSVPLTLLSRRLCTHSLPPASRGTI